MPHNFKLTGDYYVSKYGSDSNAGTSPDLPKRTVQAGLNLMTSSGAKLIIGAGVYRENIIKSFANISGAVWSVFADGNVILDGVGLGSIAIGFSNAATGANIYINGIKIRNYYYAELAIGNYRVNGIAFANYINCEISNCRILMTAFASGDSTHGTLVFTNSVIISSKISNTITYIGTSATRYGAINFTSSILINVSLTQFEDYYYAGGVGYQACPITILKDCFVDSNTYLRYSPVTTTGFNYNNIQAGIIVMGASTITTGIYQDSYGRYYNLAITTSTGSGTVGDPYGRPYTSGTAFSFATHRILYPTYNVNSFSADPLFNNILKQDFTLQSTSPHLYRASDGINNIGGTQLATRVASTSASLSGGSVSVSSLNLSGSDYVVTSPATSGFVVSAPLLVNATAKVLKVINYNGLLAFNKDNAGATATNLNVPDALTFTAASAQAGANPDRLTYYMRWSTGASQPAVDADWDNGSMVTAGNYSLFEWNTKPYLDYSARGNGEQNFDIAATPTYIKATYIQLKVVLRNDYLI